MARKPRKSTVKLFPNPSEAIAPRSKLPLAPIAGTDIMPAEVYRNEYHPSTRGPWENEPDKVAWTDEATGYPCIVVREYTGEFGSYVSVPGDHPLSGFTTDALPSAISEGLHRPVTYSRGCDRTTPERRSICHVDHKGRLTPRAHRELPQHDDAWWLGVTLDGPRDFCPNSNYTPPLAAERGRTYRDVSFAANQATLLARRLHEYAQGKLGHERGIAIEVTRVLPAPKREDER